MNLTYDSQMFRETFESEFTWLNGFMRNVRRFSDKPAAIDPQSGRTWSYKELNADANRFANAMKKTASRKTTSCLCSFTTHRSFCLVTLRRRNSVQSQIPLTLTYHRAKPLKLWDTTSQQFMFTTQTLCKQPYRLLKSASISQN